MIVVQSESSFSKLVRVNRRLNCEWVPHHTCPIGVIHLGLWHSRTLNSIRVNKNGLLYAWIALTFNWAGLVLEQRLYLTWINKPQSSQCYHSCPVDWNESGLRVDQIRVIVAIGFIIAGEVNAIHRYFNYQHIRLSIFGNSSHNCCATDYLTVSEDLIAIFILKAHLYIVTIFVGTGEVRTMDRYVGFTQWFDWSECRLKLDHVRSWIILKTLTFRWVFNILPVLSVFADLEKHHSIWLLRWGYKSYQVISELITLQLLFKHHRFGRRIYKTQPKSVLMLSICITLQRCKSLSLNVYPCSAWRGTLLGVMEC